MTSCRPYLIRALYEWIVDNGGTPMLVVREDAADAGAEARRRDEFAVYNVSPQAVRDLAVDDESVRFHARFGGVFRRVVCDVGQVCRVFCRETGQGVDFPEQEPGPEDGAEAAPPRGRPQLRVVK